MYIETHSLPKEMGGLALIGIHTKCKAVQCSILLKSIKKYNKTKCGQTYDLASNPIQKCKTG